MGLFVMNMQNEDECTVESLVRTALANLDLYSGYCGNADKESRYKDTLGQTPPDYLVTQFAMRYLKEALELINKENLQ